MTGGCLVKRGKWILDGNRVWMRGNGEKGCMIEIGKSLAKRVLSWE